MAKKPRGEHAPDSPLRPLSPEEDALQAERGTAFRQLLKEITGDMLGVTENPGLLLSGGADSTAVLVALLDNGVKPTCVTYQVRGFLSSDGKKAQKLAAHFGLPFHVVDLPDDPDTVARTIYDMLETNQDINPYRRPDVEVTYIMQTMLRYCASIGLKSVYTGFGDMNLHILGREPEIEGRTRGMSDREITIRQVYNSEDHQIGPITRIAADLGISFCAPITVAAATFPYDGLEWRVMNLPSKKWITVRAYDDMMKDADVHVQPSPMQNGNTGSREYFDESARDSELADALAHRPVDTGMKFYNSIGAALGKEHVKSDRKKSVWEAWRKNVEGLPPKKDYVPQYQITNGGTAVPPKEPVTGDDDLFGDDGLFGSVLQAMDAPEIVVRDADGKPDLRVDCFDVPFYTGQSHDECPRAQAGLCGSHREDKPVTLTDVHACEFYDVWGTYAAGSLKDLAAELSNEGLAEVYGKWEQVVRQKVDATVAEARAQQSF